MGGFGTPGHLGSSGLIWDQLDRLNPSSPSEASALTASIDLGQSALRPAWHSPRRAFFLRGLCNRPNPRRAEGFRRIETELDQERYLDTVEVWRSAARRRGTRSARFSSASSPGRRNADSESPPASAAGSNSRGRPPRSRSASRTPRRRSDLSASGLYPGRIALLFQLAVRRGERT